MEHSITIEENSVHSKPCISKVHVGLTRNVPEAYKPALVSIGPYHKGESNLEAMQQNKEWYLNLLLTRRNKSLESRDYFSKLKEFEREARECYVDPVSTINDEFTKMMLLDGCFVVEFLRKLDNDVAVDFENEDPLLNVSWMGNQILSDMILLENQLPYFVLSKVYNMTKDEGEKPLEEMVMSCFNFMLPRPRLNFNNVVSNNAQEINHLLHLVHIFGRPFPKKTSRISTDSEISDQTTCPPSFAKRIITCGIGESSNDQTHCPLLPQNSADSGNDKSSKMKGHMRTVVELQEAGVKFKKVGEIYDGVLKEQIKNYYVSLFDMEFDRGVMKIPCFKVDGSTEALLRNLIAYEQHFDQDFLEDNPKYFTDFATLMNQLINSEKDAKVLRIEEIIMNFLGDDEELSKLFNSLTKGVCESYEPYYLEESNKVDKHCKTKWHIVMAKLRRDYFNNPWAGISTFAAAFLLFLTVVQAVVALITLLT